ncbi:MAG: flavin reductase [candidate division Zixibacteria bacterium RBG_16_53_22]|nr:MAG: flavin reductase [candidate division Zixibacteria bacterium RBG_16_53_22]
MAKKIFEPMTALIPLPAVMVTCQRPGDRPNIITIAWTGIICSEPPMISISIRKNRFSHEIIRDTGEFVVNITTQALAEATDICGVASGRNTDKFKLAGLTATPASIVQVPLIEECPINLECQTRRVLELGSHDMFIAEIVATQIDEQVFDERGRLDIEKLDPLIYCTKARQYWAGATVMVGAYGYTKGRPAIREKS